MRTLARGVSGALALLAMVGVAPAAATTSGVPPKGYELISTAAFYTTTTVVEGVADGHAGNVHTAVLTLEGDDDWITGQLIDWTCPTGVEPPFGSTEVTECVVEKSWSITDPNVEVDVRWSPDLRKITIVGPVLLTTDASGFQRTAFIDIRGRATGAITRTITQVDDFYDVLSERTGATSTGRIAWMRLRAPGAVTEASNVVVYQSFQKTLAAS